MRLKLNRGIEQRRTRRAQGMLRHGAGITHGSAMLDAVNCLVTKKQPRAARPITRATFLTLTLLALAHAKYAATFLKAQPALQLSP